jgi:aspartyl-tRNA(Asn)/glutamyl-tRNA(Gln) amidotransferase subunit C
MTSLFSAENVEHLANISRIKLSAEEVARLTSELNVINDAIAKVSEVANEDVDITSHPVDIGTVYRNDVPATLHLGGEKAPEGGYDVEGAFGGNTASPYEGDLLSLEQALSGAPRSESGQFVAPQILGEE